MDLSAEKEDIIRRFRLVHDAGLVNAIKSLLDFGLHKQETDDEEAAALNASIERGLNDAKNGNVRPHEEVMSELRKRYGL